MEKKSGNIVLIGKNMVTVNSLLKIEDLRVRGIPLPLSDGLGPKTPGMAALDQQIDGPFGRPGGDPSTRGRFMRCSMRFNIKPGCLLLLGGLNVGPPL